MRTKEIKAIALMLMLPLLVLTACSSSSDSSDVVVPEPDKPVVQQHPIGFSGIFADSEGGATSAPATRGVGDGEFTNTELQASGFGVYCWYTGGNTYVKGNHIKDVTSEILMLNQKVEYKDSKWTYAPSKYWPLNNQEMLTFRAYAPYVSYQLQTDDDGLPLLPVVVKATDYHDGTQHDPLWGTGRLVDPSTDEYAVETTYGELYDNIKYEMSGDNRLKATVPADTRNGVIDWYFHHGMAKLMFVCSVIANPGCDKVTIRSIKIEGLYTQGLLSLSSPTATKDEKPEWTECDGNMTVTLSEATPNTDAGDLAPTPGAADPYPFVITTNPSQATALVDLLEHGLLIIPRNFSSEGLKVTVTYSIDDDPTRLEAKGTIKQDFQGNTSYMMRLSLTPSTKGLEITLVQSAFTPWHEAGTGDQEVYNW